jgi:hypothetical protein
LGLFHVRYRRESVKNLLWKFFPPYEVKLTQQELKSFLDQSAGVCRNTIERELIYLVKDAEKTVYSIRIDNMKPEHLALLLVTNVLGRHIGSGHYHTYRGVLNTMGADFYKLWNSAQKIMLERGYSTEAEVTEDNLWIKKQIQNAG